MHTTNITAVMATVALCATLGCSTGTTVLDKSMEKSVHLSLGKHSS